MPELRSESLDAIVAALKVISVQLDDIKQRIHDQREATIGEIEGRKV